MSNVDLIQFSAYVSRNKTLVAYVMPLVTDVASVKFKRDFISHVDQNLDVIGYVNQKVDNEVEL